MVSTPSTETSRLTPAEAMVLTVITLGGGVLRFYNLGLKSLWYDEAVVYHLVQGSWREILTQNALENSAPPLYALLLGLLTGEYASEAALRALSAVAGTLAIPLLYLLGREFLPARSAWLVALLAAVAPTQLVYAQELREYSLTVSIATLLLLAYSRFIREPGTRQAGLVAAAAVLGLLTQYGLALLLAALNLVCLAWFARARRPWASYRRWLVAQLPAAVVAVVLYLTVMRYQVGLVSEAGLGYLKPYYWDGTNRGLLILLLSPANDVVGYAFPGIVVQVLTLVGALACVFGAASGLATAFLLVPVALTFLAAVAQVYPYGAIRQDIFLTPMIYVAVALGVDRLLAALPRRGSALTRPAALALLALVLVVPALAFARHELNQPGKQPMRSVVEALAGRLRPGETIYVYYNAIPAFRYYWRDRPEPWMRGTLHRSWMDDANAADQMLKVEDEIRALIDQGQPCWVVLSHIADSDQERLFQFLAQAAAANVVAGASGSWLIRLIPRGGTPPGNQLPEGWSVPGR